jgi:hypothetical protein
MKLIERLEAVASQIEAMISDGKISVFEVIDAVKLLGTCVAETIKDLPEAPTQSQVEDMLLEAWNWADERFALVEKADAAIKLNAFLEPFDAMAIRKLVVDVGIPQLAKKLAA